MVFLVTLCASHINEAKRLSSLKSAVKSHSNQTLSTPLFISISFEDAFEKLVDDLIESLTTISIKFFKQKGRLSQFQHYKYLAEQFDTIVTNRLWCLFMDDDDYLNCKRNSLFASLLPSVNKRNETSLLIMPVMMTSWDGDIDQKQLEKWLKMGINSTTVVPTTEYVCYSVQLSLLKRFCEFLARHKKIGYNQCDVAFAYLLSNICQTYVDRCEWLYAYNRTNTHLRITHMEKVDRYIAEFDEALFDDMATEFKFTHISDMLKGQTSVYGASTYRAAFEARKSAT